MFLARGGGGLANASVTRGDSTTHIRGSRNINILSKSKDLINDSIFKKVDFDSSFELISIILIFYMKVFKDKKQLKYNKINDELIKNFITDLDKTMREAGIGDMSIGKYVKRYVKKFYYRINIIDSLLENYDDKKFINYLNSLEKINEECTSKLTLNLIDIYQNLKKNKDII